MKRPVNFYIGALVITIIGGLATLFIVWTNNSVDDSVYAGVTATTTNPEIPSLREELKIR